MEDRVLLESVPSASISGFDAESAPPLRPVSVLVADDERDIVLTLEPILRDEGYETQGAYSGDDVLKKARTTRPDAVILDIQMRAPADSQSHASCARSTASTARLCSSPSPGNGRRAP